MQSKVQEQLPIRFQFVEQKADVQGAAQALALHFTQGDAEAYMRRAIERKRERIREKKERGVFTIWDLTPEAQRHAYEGYCKAMDDDLNREYTVPFEQFCQEASWADFEFDKNGNVIP